MTGEVNPSEAFTKYQAKFMVEFGLIRQVVRKVDGEVNNLYHALEADNLSGAQIMRVASKLRRALILRRQTKEECAKMHGIYEKLKTINMEYIEGKSKCRLAKYKQETQNYIDSEQLLA